MIWEVSRKIRAPKDENDYTTYSKLFGYKKSTKFVLIVTIIDIIAESKEDIIFVEVKTREENSLVSGAEAVDGGKIGRVKNAAVSFMQRLNSDLPFRVDIAEVTYNNSGDTIKWKLHYIKNV